MKTPHKPLLIALDADGVLLDYNKQFGRIWARHFGEEPVCVEPKAYHATNYWGLQAPSHDHPFWSDFDSDGWTNMPAMPGAVEACRRLVAAGHRLVCVTSMPSHRQAHRLGNLQAEGFPIHEVIATGSKTDKLANPKKEAIEELKPDWFVDDELRKLKGLSGVNCVLVDPIHPDSPNENQDDTYLAMRVTSLQEFADSLLGSQALSEG